MRRTGERNREMDDPRLAREMPVLVAAGKTAGVPYRMTEGNSCYHGGQPGMSDAFASALWAADYLLFVAQAGYAGVNLHGGEGYYAPITGEPNATKLRPEYYGMPLAQQFAGTTFVGASLGGDARDVNGYAARVEDALVDGVLDADRTIARCEDGVRFAQANMDERLVPAYSAVL